MYNMISYTSILYMITISDFLSVNYKTIDDSVKSKWTKLEVKTLIIVTFIAAAC